MPPRKRTQPAAEDAAYDGVPTVNVKVDADPEPEALVGAVVPLEVVDVPVEHVPTVDDEQPVSDEA